MFVLPEFLSAQTCVRLRAAIDESVLSAAEVAVNGFRVDDTVRRTLEADVAPDIVSDVDGALAAVRPSVAAFFQMPLEHAEGAGFLRYLPGGFYRLHRDVLDGEHHRFPRRISVVVFLTSATAAGVADGLCEGGTLRIHLDGSDEPSIVDVIPIAGTLVAFGSETLHEVLPVTAGTRDVVVDWFF